MLATAFFSKEEGVENTRVGRDTSVEAMTIKQTTSIDPEPFPALALVGTKSPTLRAPGLC
jgi:hypothetical protein